MTQDHLSRHAQWVHRNPSEQDVLLAQAIANERARIVRDLHDGLGSQLSSLLLTVKSQPFTRAELVDEVSDAIDQLRLEIDSLDTADPDVPSLLGQVRHRLDRRLSRACVTVQWCIDPFPEGVCVTDHQAHHLRHFLYEALSNVIKHAQANCVRIEAHHDPSSGSSWLVIEDDGRGFDLAGAKGRGLKNLAYRAEQIGASVTIDSQAQKGTVVTLRWPCLVDGTPPQ